MAGRRAGPRVEENRADGAAQDAGGAGGEHPVERQLGVALWRQIADRIRAAIADGAYDGTGRLPPEAALASEFGVNRHTVRSAIASLTEEGIVRPMQGLGTLIERQERLQFPISRRTRFSAGLADQTRDIATRLLASDRIAAGAEIARALKLEAGAEVIRLDIVSAAAARPVSTSTAYFPAARFPEMAACFRRTGSVTRAFAEQGLSDYVRQSTDIIARHADAGERSLLSLSPGSIVLQATAINVDLEGRPVQYARTRFAADRVQLHIET